MALDYDVRSFRGHNTITKKWTESEPQDRAMGRPVLWMRVGLDVQPVDADT